MKIAGITKLFLHLTVSYFTDLQNCCLKIAKLKNKLNNLIILVHIIFKYFLISALFPCFLKVISKKIAVQAIYLFYWCITFFFLPHFNSKIWPEIFVLVWLHVFTWWSTLSESGSFKLRNKFAEFCAFYKMCTIISSFLPTTVTATFDDNLTSETFHVNYYR